MLNLFLVQQKIFKFILQNIGNHKSPGNINIIILIKKISNHTEEPQISRENCEIVLPVNKSNAIYSILMVNDLRNHNLNCKFKIKNPLYVLILI